MIKISHRLVKDEPAPAGEYNELLDALNPVFFSTLALAFGRCYEALLVMYDLARTNIGRAFAVIAQYDEAAVAQIASQEDDVDRIADRVSNYLIQVSAHITAPNHVEIMNHYFTVVSEFERLSDHAQDIAGIAESLHRNQAEFSRAAVSELNILRQLLDTILEYCGMTFEKRNLAAARHIEPLEQVVDDMVRTLKDNHLERLRSGVCSTLVGTEFLNLLTEVSFISDVCSNIGVATIARAVPDIKHQTHNYIAMLHSGQDKAFNQEYRTAHDKYFGLLQACRTHS